MSGRSFHPGRTDKTFVQLLHAEDQFSGPFVNRFPQFFEETHTLAFVFHFGVLLCHTTLADSRTEVVHRKQVIFPSGVDDFQEYKSLHPSHLWMVMILDNTNELGPELILIQRLELFDGQLVVKFGL